MTPTAEFERPLHYFIHNDWDALRMELSGRFIGKAAREAYESLRNASFLPRRLPVVIDISYVAEADAEGLAILRRWREQDGRILAATPTSRAIAESILRAPMARSLPRPRSFAHVASLFSRAASLGAAFLGVTAGITAHGKRNHVASAAAKEKNTDIARFPLQSGLEQQVRKTWRRPNGAFEHKHKGVDKCFRRAC